MKIKLQFKRKDNGEVINVELFPQDVVKKVGYIATMRHGDKTYAWPFGSCNVFECEGNVLCAKYIDLEYLYVKYVNM